MMLPGPPPMPPPGARVKPPMPPLATVLLGALLLAACAGTSPAVRLYHLPSASPVAAAAAPAAARGSWVLMSPVLVPEYLDREALLLPQGTAGLAAANGERWAESLRDSVPRVLKQDLTTLLGEGRLWASPAPPGAAPTHQLRVELLTLQAEPDRRGVKLQARWTLADASGASPPRAASATFVVPSAGGDIDSLVAAHRLALWRLAERIVATP